MSPSLRESQAQVVCQVSDRARVPGCERYESHTIFSWLLLLCCSSLNHTAGNLFSGMEIVEQQLAVSAQRAGDLLHRLDAGSHRLTAPGIQEHAGPGGRVVFPELLKIFNPNYGTPLRIN